MRKIRVSVVFGGGGGGGEEGGGEGPNVCH